MKAWLRQARVRLTLAYSVVFTIVALVGAAGLLLAVAQIELRSLDESLTSAARSIQPGIQSSDGQKLPKPGVEDVSAYLFDRNGGLVDTSGGAPSAGTATAVARRVPRDGSALRETETTNGSPERFRAASIPLTNGESRVLVVSRSQAAAVQLVTTTGSVVVLGLLGLVVVATVLGYGLARTALRPVREITAAARTFSEQDLHRRIEIDLPADELGELAATFNSMLARLETAFGSLSRFTADAAHELRAPLTLIRTEVEVALSRERSAKDYQASLQTVLGEAERLSRLADQLLMLARAEAGALATRMQPIDLAELISAAVPIWRTVATERGVELLADVPRPAPVRGDADLLRRLLDNLVDNALRHSTAGDTVRIDCFAAGSRGWELTVADSGEGVPEAARASIFERFSRADQSRNRDTGGAGLGLALCAAIAQLHHGSIELDRAHSPGARFIVHLPIAPS
ncbi:MAG: ATP-binding protein [Candidatus Dormibacteria bacterium]